MLKKMIKKIRRKYRALIYNRPCEVCGKMYQFRHKCRNVAKASEIDAMRKEFWRKGTLGNLREGAKILNEFACGDQNKKDESASSLNPAFSNPEEMIKETLDKCPAEELEAEIYRMFYGFPCDSVGRIMRDYYSASPELAAKFQPYSPCLSEKELAEFIISHPRPERIGKGNEEDKPCL